MIAVGVGECHVHTLTEKVTLLTLTFSPGERRTRAKRREGGWKIVAGLMSIHAILQIAAVAMIIHVYRNDERFKVGAHLDTASDFGVASALVSLAMVFALAFTGLAAGKFMVITKRAPSTTATQFPPALEQKPASHGQVANPSANTKRIGVHGQAGKSQFRQANAMPSTRGQVCWMVSQRRQMYAMLRPPLVVAGLWKSRFEVELAG
jgi:hypothetical protein